MVTEEEDIVDDIHHMVGIQVIDAITGILDAGDITNGSLRSSL